MGLAVWGMLGRVATQCMVVAREIPLPQAWGITGMWKAEARAEIFKNSETPPVALISGWAMSTAPFWKASRN